MGNQNNNNLKKEEIVKILKSKGVEQQSLFNSSFDLRKQYFDYEVYPRGVLEISNHCQLNCMYCGMRKENKKLVRYRMDYKTILNSALYMKHVGIKSIMLQSGDDYLFPINKLVDIIRLIKAETNLHIILCLGERKKSDLVKMFNAGANMYILKLETINPGLYKYLRPNTTFTKRLELLQFIKNIGYEISSGLIIGLPGQTINEIAEGLMLLKEIKVDSSSVSPFIPNHGSPFINEPFGNLDISLNTLALMRLMFGKVNIPSVSAFSILTSNGQIRAFKAGANVITINFSPKENLHNYLIYDTNRKIVSLDNAIKIVKDSGLNSSILKKHLKEFNTQSIV